MFGHTKVQYFYKFRSEGWKENFPCVHILTGKIFFVLQGILFSLLGSCSHYRNLSACPLLYPVQDCNVTLQVRFGELSQVPCIFSKFSKTDLQRHCESGNPPRVPSGVLGPPPPPKGPPWTPWAFVGAGATIFVSATYFTTTRKLELGKPSQGPPGCSWNPWRTPWDPLGVCRCWGYNFCLGNLFYYYVFEV